MLDSVRSSIIAATFRVNDRPNAKPNPDASFPDFRNLGGKDIDGERRLMYVGVTRASRALWLSRPRVRQTKFGSRAQEPSRFLLEMRLQDPHREKTPNHAQTPVQTEVTLTGKNTLNQVENQCAKKLKSARMVRI